MSFLAPVPALIAAAIAVPVLVAFYLLKLRRRPVRVSSTMLWDQAVQDLQANVPLRWLRPSWLLLLHLLILASLLLALARPVIDVASTRADRIILIIDASASMSARDGEGGVTRFETGVERARAYVESLRAGGFSGQMAVIASAGDARVVAGPTGDLRRIRSALASIEPTDQPGSIRAALELAEAIARQRREEDEPVESVLTIFYSDGGDAGNGSLKIAGSEFRFERVGPSVEQWAGPAEGGEDGDEPGSRGLDNLGLVALSARRAYDDPALIRVFARAQNALERELAATITLRVDGEARRRVGVTIPPAEIDDEVPGDDPALEPGQKSVTFELTEPRAVLIELVIARSDLLAADDQAWLRVPPAARPAVLVVRPDPQSEEADGEAPRDGTDWIIDDVLTELDLREIRRRRAGEYAANPDAALDEIDLVIFEGVAPEVPPPVPSLSFGAGMPVPGLGLEEPPAGVSGTYILSWQRGHPLLRDVALDAVFIAETRVIDTDGRSEALARGAPGTLIAMGDDAGTPRVVVAFDLAQSNWRLSVGFAIFLARAVDLLSERSQPIPPGPLITSEPISVRPASTASRIEVRRPSGETVTTVPREQWPDRGPVPLGVMRRTGVYELRGAETSRLGVSLLDAGESSLRTRDALNVSGARVESTGHAGERPVEIWHWFVLVAAALLAVEWVIYAARMRV